MRKLSLLFFVFVCIQIQLQAQNWCASQDVNNLIESDITLTAEQKRQMHEKAHLDEIALKKKAEAYYTGSRKAGKKIIPVVIHVLHNNGPENISDEDAIAGLEKMNLDFANANADRDEVVEAFQSIVDDMEIEFRLATIDPDGNCTNGIIRHQVSDPYFNNNRGAIEAAKTQFHWDVDKYFNIYTLGSIGCTDGSCTLGYAYYPNVLDNPNFRNNYGFVAIYNNFIAPSTDRTSGVGTHEMGHALDLPHVWGNSNDAGLPENCATDDDIADTPNTTGNRSVCNKSAVNCGSLDNVQNYMDYSFCFANFTKGQKARMHAAIDTYLSNQTSATNLVETGTDYVSRDELTALCEVNFKVDASNEVVVCPGTEVSFTDESFHNPTSWNWTFEGGTPASSTEQNPQVVYNTAGSYAVSLEISNTSGTLTRTQSKVVKVTENLGQILPILESFEPYTSLDDQSLLITTNREGNNGFEITQVAGATGEQSIFLENFGEGNGNLDVLTSNIVDLSNYNLATDLKFTFKYAFTGINDIHVDKLDVAYSDDCGITWKTRKTITGTALQTVEPTSSQFIPSSPSDWKEASVTMIGFTINDNFRFRFTFSSSANGNNLYIDDINIYHKDEVGITEQEALANAVSVFPVPAKEMATVTIVVAQMQTYTVEVLDITGRVVATVLNKQLSSGSHQTTINVNSFTNGVYFVRVKANAESVIKRLIVSK